MMVDMSIGRIVIGVSKMNGRHIRKVGEFLVQTRDRDGPVLPPAAFVMVQQSEQMMSNQSEWRLAMMQKSSPYKRHPLYKDFKASLVPARILNCSY